jgi:hypothetical protein
LLKNFFYHEYAHTLDSNEDILLNNYYNKMLKLQQVDPIVAKKMIKRPSEEIIKSWQRSLLKMENDADAKALIFSAKYLMSEHGMIKGLSFFNELSQGILNFRNDIVQRAFSVDEDMLDFLEYNHYISTHLTQLIIKATHSYVNIYAQHVFLMDNTQASDLSSNIVNQTFEDVNNEAGLYSMRGQIDLCKGENSVKLNQVNIINLGSQLVKAPPENFIKKYKEKLISENYNY